MQAKASDSPNEIGGPAETLSALKRFSRSRPQVERCALCSAPVAEEHQHLMERQSRRIECACDACAILFCGQEGSKYLRVPRRIRQLRDFAFTDLQWEEMMIPINMAFFFKDENGRMTAMYPSPGGAIESLLESDSWDEIFAQCPALQKMEPEVEALLVNRIGEGGTFIVPIDECYKLVGVIRMNWRGLSGGAEVWKAIADFFEQLEQKAGTRRQVQHA
jgi:hypothetical protein